MQSRAFCLGYVSNLNLIAARRCGRRWSVAAASSRRCWLRALTSPLWPRRSFEIDRPGVTVVRRPFEDADLDGAWWVVAAAPAHVNKRVRAAADARRIFVNAVDDPLHATAYLGGVVKRDGVTIAISTDGRARAVRLAARGYRRGAPSRSRSTGCRLLTPSGECGKNTTSRWSAGVRNLLDTLNKLYARKGEREGKGARIRVTRRRGPR